MKNPKFFTIKEAGQLIGLLETAIERIKRNKRQFLWLQEELNVLDIIVSCGASAKNRDVVELDGKKKKFKELARQIDMNRSHLQTLLKKHGLRSKDYRAKS